MTHCSDFDPELIRRYDRAVPRYTSYPSAPAFHSDFSRAELRHAEAASARKDEPVSLYVHIPYCESPCFYCGCHRIVTRQHEVAAPYLDGIEAELRLRAPLEAPSRRVAQLHLGGGTPTFLSDRELERLLHAIGAHYALSRDAKREYSIEIDPRTLRPDTVALLAELGFNRLSFGVQDLTPAVQEAINRIQPLAMTQTAVEQARAHRLAVAVDLILGLPRQTPASFTASLRDVIALAPDRISLYSYAHLPQRFKAQRQLDARQLPDAATKLRLMQIAVDELGNAGYLHIGMDHFARPDDELAVAQRLGHLQRNFQGYSTHGGLDLFAYGVSAISQIGNVYVQNLKIPEAYRQKLADGERPIERGYVMSAEDRLRADIIGRLMCAGRVDLAAVAASHDGIDAAQHFASEIAALPDLARDGLIELDGMQILVTGKGRFLLRVIASVFDAHLRQAADVTHSKAI